MFHSSTLICVTIAEKIFALLREKGMTQGKLLRKTGIARTRLWRVSKGLSRFSDSHVREISLVLGVTTDYLLNNSKGYPPTNGDRLPVKLERRLELIKEAGKIYETTIPILIKVAANGTPEIEFTEDGFPLGETGESVIRPPGLSENVYGAIVFGDSLSPGIPDKSVIIAESGMPQWDKVKRGDTVIVKARGLVYVKGLDFDNDWVYLKSTNALPLPRRKEEVQILHKVLWVKMP